MIRVRIPTLKNLCNNWILTNIDDEATINRRFLATLEDLPLEVIEDLLTFQRKEHPYLMGKAKNAHYLLTSKLRTFESKFNSFIKEEKEFGNIQSVWAKLNRNCRKLTSISLVFETGNYSDRRQASPLMERNLSSWHGCLPNLTWLRLEYCELSGPDIATIGQLGNRLKGLSLAGGRFQTEYLYSLVKPVIPWYEIPEVSLPEETCGKCRNLQYLDISNTDTQLVNAAKLFIDMASTREVKSFNVNDSLVVMLRILDIIEKDHKEDPKWQDFQLPFACIEWDEQINYKFRPQYFRRILPYLRPGINGGLQFRFRNFSTIRTTDPRIGQKPLSPVKDFPPIRELEFSSEREDLYIEMFKTNVAPLIQSHCNSLTKIFLKRVKRVNLSTIVNFLQHLEFLELDSVSHTQYRPGMEIVSRLSLKTLILRGPSHCSTEELKSILVNSCQLERLVLDRYQVFDDDLVEYVRRRRGLDKLKILEVDRIDSISFWTLYKYLIKSDCIDQLTLHKCAKITNQDIQRFRRKLAVQKRFRINAM